MAEREEEDLSDESDAELGPGDTPDLNNPRQVKAREKRAKAREGLRKRFILKLLSDRDGREWMWELLSRGRVFTTSFVAGDSHATAFQEGMRNLALTVLAEIPPASLKTMLDEADEYGR